MSDYLINLDSLTKTLKDSTETLIGSSISPEEMFQQIMAYTLIDIAWSLRKISERTTGGD